MLGVERELKYVDAGGCGFMQHDALAVGRYARRVLKIRRIRQSFGRSVPIC
jgi:hypothetical protein